MEGLLLWRVIVVLVRGRCLRTVEPEGIGGAASVAFVQQIGVVVQQRVAETIDRRSSWAGMERWLSQRLSASLGASPERRDGVCANVLFPPPRRLIGDAIATASGIDPESDPWLPERAAWRLLEVVDESLGEPWLQRLSAHLGSREGLLCSEWGAGDR